jgi:hypothetical protein
MKEDNGQTPTRYSTLLIILLFGYLYPAFLFGIVAPLMGDNTTLKYLFMEFCREPAEKEGCLRRSHTHG